MEPSAVNQNQTEEDILVRDDEVQHLMQHLPKATCYGGKLQLIKYQNFWHLDHDVSSFTSTLAFQRHFRSRDTDLIIASHPKTGTTWLKSLLYAIVNRVHHPTNQSPLLAHHPHELVYRLEYDIYGDSFPYPRPHHLNELPSPRLFSTHLPYQSLPESIKISRCRILYIGRNPLDTCVSQWHFYLKSLQKMMKEDFEPPPIEDYFEEFFEGRILFGPFFEHMLGYWHKSLEQQNKVLFLKYEDLKDNTTLQLKRLAEFVGLPFSPEEESQGVIDEIVNLCSIQNLKEVEGNKSGIFNKFFEKKSYFRKGEVGDWTHYFPSAIVERMNTLMEEKLGGTSLSFKLLPS